MFPQTDKSKRDYKALNQNWSYQPTLAGRAITVFLTLLIWYKCACSNQSVNPCNLRTALIFCLKNLFSSSPYGVFEQQRLISDFADELEAPFLAWAWLAKDIGDSCHTKNQLLLKQFTEKRVKVRSTPGHYATKKIR